METWQPLDAFIFGELKNIAAAEFNKKTAESGPGGERNMDVYVAIQIPWDLWKHLEQSAILQVWSCFVPGRAADDTGL